VVPAAPITEATTRAFLKAEVTPPGVVVTSGAQGGECKWQSLDTQGWRRQRVRQTHFKEPGTVFKGKDKSKGTGTNVKKRGRSETQRSAARWGALVHQRGGCPPTEQLPLLIGSQPREVVKGGEG